MRWSSVILSLLATTQFVSCDPLTAVENEQRLSSCGKKMTSKVYMGREAKQKEAPWSVFFLLYNEDKTGATTCTGTIVSPRHVLIATHCFAELNNKDGKWRIDGKPFEKSDCENDDYVIKDDNILKRIKILSENKVVSKHPEKVTLVKSCLARTAVKTNVYGNVLPSYYTDDFAIIDLYEDLTFSSTIQTVCVASGTAENSVNTTLDYFGYGLNPPKGEIQGKDDSSGVLRHESIKVTGNNAMEDYYFIAKDPKSETVACVGDSGGGAIKDQKTIVGVLSQTNCADITKRGDGSMEQYASVGYYNEDICKLTGICDTTQVYDKYYEGYVKKAKPPRPTEAPIVSQRPVGGATVADPNGTNGKSPATNNQEVTEEPMNTPQESPVDQNLVEVDPNDANRKYLHVVLSLISLFTMF